MCSSDLKQCTAATDTATVAATVAATHPIKSPSITTVGFLMEDEKMKFMNC